MKNTRGRKIFEKLKAQTEDHTIDSQGAGIQKRGRGHSGVKSLAGGPASGLTRNNSSEFKFTPEDQASCHLSISQSVLRDKTWIGSCMPCWGAISAVVGREQGSMPGQAPSGCPGTHASTIFPCSHMNARRSFCECELNA